MPVNVSSVARRRSSQPRSAAATSIAYSPEPGRPRSDVQSGAAAAIRSSSGSAGLTRGCRRPRRCRARSRGSPRGRWPGPSGSPPVAERGRAIGRLAKRPVEGRRVLGGVGHDRRVADPAASRPPGSRRPGRPSSRDGATMSAPAWAWRRRSREARDASGRCQRAVRRSGPAVAVVGVLAQAGVGDRDEGSSRSRSRGAPAGRRRPRPRARALGVLASGRPNRMTPPIPSPATAPRRGPPRRATDGRRRASSRSGRGGRCPARTKRGATNMHGWSRVSRTSARRARRPAQAAGPIGRHVAR